MKWIYESARYFVGALFIFSGLIKVNDPVGTAIKLEEYFDVFADDFAPFFEHFVPAALFLSVFLCVLEIILGIALIIGFRIKETAWVLLGIIVFFSFLTFYSAYFNKVTDCGCFGDAIKLTPWESFTKDMILLVFILIIIAFRDKYTSFFPAWFQWTKMIGATIFFTGVALYCIWHLPIIDFRAYAIGNNLPALMQPSAPLTYEYVMKKDGEEFIFDEYPADGGYEYVAMNLTNPEAQPKITDLNVWTDEDEYTDLLMEGIKLIVIIQSVDKADESSAAEIKTLISQLDANVTPWILTSSGADDIEPFLAKHGLDVPYYYGDATVLKTMVRSNPGLILLSNGTVLGKWHYNDVPEITTIKQLL